MKQKGCEIILPDHFTALIVLSETVFIKFTDLPAFSAQLCACRDVIVHHQKMQFFLSISVIYG